MQEAQALSWAERGIARTDALVLPVILLVTYAVYFFSPVTTSTDSAWTFHMAASIIQEHNINLDEYGPLMKLPVEYRVRAVDNHIYSYYPVATPLLVTPAVWLINKVYPLIYPTDFYTYLATHAPDSRTAKLEKVLAAGIVALATAVMYLIARRELSTTKSLAVAFIFAFSTSMWSTASRALWQHGPSALFLSLALLLLLMSKDKPALIFWVGVILGFSYLIRPTNSLGIGFIGLYLAINRRRQLWLYAAGVFLMLLPYILQNWLTYRNPLPPYSYQLFERLGTPKAFAEGLAGTLISPARGLLIFSPLFLFAIYGAYLRLRGRLSFANLHCYLAAIVVTHWAMTSLFEDWGGAWSIGPRYFVDIIPLLVYFLIPVLNSSLLAVRMWRTAFITTVIISTLIQFHCSTSIYPFMWNGKPKALVEAPERKWDWGDLQFLRGFCPRDPLEGRAPACWFNVND
jgi:hypothetical protein